MKTKFLIIISSLFLISCFDGFIDIEELHPGFYLTAFTNQEEFGEFDGELFIGGVKDSVFIPIGSTLFHFDGGFHRTSTAFYYDENNNKTLYHNENNWNPNLDAIKNIPSDNYYFLLKLSEDRQEIIKWGEDIETAFRIDTSIEIKEFPLRIIIDDDKIRISTRTTSNYRVPNDTIRVLPENYVHEPL